jgi:DNA-directed RNA polymerase specialized sigma24 family protein
MGFAESVQRLHDGRSSFVEFSRETSQRWHRLALYLARRWRQPAWHSIEDIEQELLLGAWKHVWKFDPARGTSLERYVIFNAVDHAKKAVHVARGASLSGSADRNPGHIEVLWDEEDEHKAGILMSEDAEQDDAVRVREALDAVKRECENVQELLSIDALAKTGSVELAGARLYGDPGTRLACRMVSEDHAVRVVDTAVSVLAVRLLDL